MEVPQQSVRDYKLQKRLGSGAFGEVYQAFDKQGKVYALKIVDVSKGEKYFKEECSLLAKAKHANIMKFHQAFTDTICGKKCGFIVTELADGSLSEPLRAGQHITFSFAQDVTSQLLAALDHLHERRIVHADLKPENILYFGEQGEGGVKLCDFGLATKLHPCQATYFPGCRGTYYFMAPEQFQGSLDCSADVWALGATLYYLFTGKLPFKQPHVDCTPDVEAGYVAYQVAHLEVEYPLNMPEQLKDFIKATMTRDPELRPTCKQLMTHPFVAHLCAMPPPAEQRPLSPGMLARRPNPNQGPTSPEQQVRLGRAVVAPPGFTHMARPAAQPTSSPQTGLRSYMHLLLGDPLRQQTQPNAAAARPPSALPDDELNMQTECSSRESTRSIQQERDTASEASTASGEVNVEDLIEILTEPEFLTAGSKWGSAEVDETEHLQTASPLAAVHEEDQAVLEAMRNTLADADKMAKATQEYASGLKDTFKLLEASLGRRQTQAAAVATQPAVAGGRLGASALSLIKGCWQVGKKCMEIFEA